MLRLLSILRRRLWSSLALHNVGKHGNPVFVNKKSTFTHKTEIGNNCHFNGARLTGDGKIVIGDNFHSGGGLLMITSTHNYDCGNALPYDETYITKDIIVEDNVWIGENVIVLAGAHLGEGCIIQAGSVVVGYIPPCAIVGGHPAKIFKYRNLDHYEALKKKNSYF